ncbi:hypothetical protein [Gottfriedia luciferensis]|nr:hypothetical protein [Gottfriedia luciferensis]
MFLVIGFCTMLLFYLVGITTLFILTLNQGMQDRKLEVTKIQN